MSLDNGYVTSDYLKKVAEQLRAFKQLSYDHMRIRPGDTVLDVGCGPGVDTLSLAERVGSAGRVIGIDTDENMLAEAEQAVIESDFRTRVEHRPGSALAIPLDDGSVASSRAERLLQVLPPENEQTVISELVRVTRARGHIVLVDADWSSASVDFSDARLERRLMEFFTLKMRPNGLAGRHLPALCRENGLTDIRIDIVPILQQRFEDTPFGDWLISTATDEGVINEAEANSWLGELQKRDDKGCFYACANLVVASGAKV